MKITIITPGMGRERNPFEPPHGSIPHPLSKWHTWNLSHPERICLDQQGNKLPPGEYDVELAWRLETVAGWEAISLKQYNERVEVNSIQSSPVYNLQQVYQSSPPQPNKGETVEEAAERLYPVEMAMKCEKFHNIENWDINANCRSAFIAGHNWKQSQGLVSVEAVVALIDSVPGVFKNSAYKLNLIEQIKNLNK